MKGEILDHHPLVTSGLRPERAEPVVDALFRQTSFALGEKDIGPCCITCGLQVVVERLAGLVQQVDITRLVPIRTHVEPALLWTNMAMLHLQPGDLTHPASRPVPQGKEGCSTQICFLLNQGTQDRALLLGELPRNELWYGRKIDAASWVALEQSLLLNQKRGKIADGRFHPRTVAETQPLLL